MADYEVKLRVDAETDAAGRELDELEEKGRRVKRALGIEQSSPAPAPQPAPAAPASTQPAPAPKSASAAPAATQPPSKPPNPRQNGREMGDEFSKVAGRAIGKAIAGFVAHEVAGIVFEGMRTYGGDNTNVNRAVATVGGALQYGTMGAMMGGPWGAAIGALVGGVTSLVGQLQKEERQRAAVDQGMRMSNWESANAAAESIGRTALSGLLDRAWTGNGGRAEILRGQVTDTLGHYQTARRRLEEASGWDQDSEGFKVRQADYQRARQQYFGALQDWADERLAGIGNAKPYDASEFGDRLSAGGMYIGPQVDAAGVNDVLGDRMQEQIGLLRQLVDISNQGAGYNSSRLAEIVEKLDKLSL